MTSLEDRSVPYAVSGIVFYDADGDGLKGNEELVAESVFVSFTPQGGTLQSRQTDASGKYEFTDVADGKHSIMFSPPSGYSVGMPVGGSTDLWVAGMDANQNAGLVLPPPPPPPPVSPPPTLPVVSVSGGGTITEGQTGNVTVSRTGDTSSALDVNLSLFGLAVNGVDYATIGTSVTIPANASSVQLSVVSLADNVVESFSETVEMGVSTGTGYTSALGLATITIADDPPVISLSPWNTTEGSDEPGYVRFIRTGGKISDPLPLTFAVFGTATNGTDFTTTSGSAVIPAGELSVDANVVALRDNIVEAYNETVTMTIEPSLNYLLEGGAVASTGIVVIVDDAPVVSVEVICNAEEGGDDGVVRFTRSGGDLANSLKVSYIVAGNATAGDDYEELFGAITIAANELTVDLSVEANDDDETDLYEVVSITVAADASVLSGSPDSCDLMIIENDGKFTGHAWNDANSDGDEDFGESTLQGIRVELWDDTVANLIASTATDANGEYELYCPSTQSDFVVQFIKPNGYSFSSVNVDSSGHTDPIDVAPFDDIVVHVGLAGHAPIVFEPIVYVEAYDGATSDMDLTANGYDPDEDDVVAVIVDSPTSGSLTFDSDNGVYYYAAWSSGTVLDGFTYYLTDGTHASDIVTISILSHTADWDSTGYQFPLMGGTLYDGTNGGLPDTISIMQGSVNDCWLIAAAAGLTASRPSHIPSLITSLPPILGTPMARVTVAGATVNASLGPDGHKYATANGDWLQALERGYANARWDATTSHGSRTPFDYLSRSEFPSRGIWALTGSSVNPRILFFTKTTTLTADVLTALNGNKIVTAVTKPFNRPPGMVDEHIYTVTSYDASTDEFIIRNPWGFNDFPYDNFQAQPGYPGGNNGYIKMTSGVFRSNFAQVAIEK